MALPLLTTFVAACSGGEGSPIISSPTTTIAPGPAIGTSTTITASLLRPIDVPGGAPGTATPFLPSAACGTRFPNIDGSTVQANVTFASTGGGPSVDETVARYPGPTAAHLAAEFRDRATRCTSPALAPGPWQVQTFTPPPVGDDVAAVALNGTGLSADLIVVRYGSTLAWLILYRRNGSIDSATRDGLITKAANRLAGL
jgi:hypothetical protein